MSKNPGATPKKHALAVLKSRGGNLHLAGKRIIRIPNDKRPGEFRIITGAEDLHTCFDAELIDGRNEILLVQWTSIKGIAARKTKIRERFIETLLTGPGCAKSVYDLRALDVRLHLEVWGWVKGKHFRCWRWYFLDSEWQEDAGFVYSPLLMAKSRQRTDPPPGPLDYDAHDEPRR